MLMRVVARPHQWPTLDVLEPPPQPFLLEGDELGRSDITSNRPMAERGRQVLADRHQVDPRRPQELGAAALEEAQVVGVVDDPREVGVLVIDPHREDVAAVANFAAERNAARRAHLHGTFPEIAGNFKETADGETGHAHGHLDYLKQVGDPATGLPIGNTEKNLKASVAGETYEYETMYPGMAKTARDEGFDDIAEWFETLAKAEKSHAGRFAKMLDVLKG